MIPPVPCRLMLVALLLPWCARAVELHLQFGALERMLADQLFTQEGRRYVRGSKTARCNFAYLESPRVQSSAGRLVIHARFTGRSAANLLGQCVGLGDAFDLTITAAPQYRDGNIGLREVRVAGDSRTGFYIRRVCNVMAASLEHDSLSIKTTAQKILGVRQPARLPGANCATSASPKFASPPMRSSWCSISN